MKIRNLKNLLIVTLFVLLIALPLITVEWKGNDYSEAEKRMLAPFPTLLQEDGNWNSNAGRETKAWLEDHIGFRAQLVQLSASIKLKLFHQSPSDRVHIGNDGWYYYTQDENLQIATGKYTFTDNVLEQILENHLAIQKKLEARGIEYMILLPTSKVSVYPEYMRYGSGEIRETPVDIVADYLEANSDLKVVRLKEPLLEAKKTQQVFFKTDTHWTQAGAYAAYREIIKRMNGWGLCGTDPVDVRFDEAEYVGEFGAMMGIDLPAEKTLNTVILEQNAVKNQESEKYNKFKTAIEAEGIYNPCYYYENTSVPGPSVMMYGDSMFGSWNATELLAENFSEFSYIWDRNIRLGLLDTMNPDIVIYELTERYLNVFPSTNAAFIQEPLEEYWATVEDYQWNGLLLEVTVKNTSRSTWKYSDQIKLGVFSGEKDTGSRALLPVGKSIKPGESVAFTFAFDNWPQALSTKLEIQMLQEGICYFGEKQQVAGPVSDLDAAIISHTAPITVNHEDSYSFDITVQNTGTKTWSENAKNRLCIWQDGADWGYRLYLPDGVTVKPGEEYTFTLQGFVLPEAESTYLEFQMLQEGICYFGEKQRADIRAE